MPKYNSYSTMRVEAKVARVVRGKNNKVLWNIVNGFYISAVMM